MDILSSFRFNIFLFFFCRYILCVLSSICEELLEYKNTMRIDIDLLKMKIFFIFNWSWLIFDIETNDIITISQKVFFSSSSTWMKVKFRAFLKSSPFRNSSPFRSVSSSTILFTRDFEEEARARRNVKNIVGREFGCVNSITNPSCLEGGGVSYSILS